MFVVKEGGSVRYEKFGFSLRNAKDIAREKQRHCSPRCTPG